MGSKYEKLGEYEKAIEFYEKNGDTIKLINLYYLNNDFDKLAKLCENEKRKDVLEVLA